MQLKQFEQKKRTLTPQKRVDVSPPPVKEEPKTSPVKTPTKSTTPNQRLKEFKSTQLTPQPNKNESNGQKTIERYQSTQITTNKQKAHDYSPKPGLNRQYKYGTYYNTTKNFYTPDKPAQKDNNRQELLRNYQNYTKSPYNNANHEYKTTSERIINIDVTPEKKKDDHQSTTPKHSAETGVQKNSDFSRRDGYFQSMNKELS